MAKSPAVVTKPKKTSIADALAVFYEPFKGSLDSPYDMSKIKGSAKRAHPNDLVEHMATLEEYLETNKTAVTYGEYDVVLLEKFKNRKTDAPFMAFSCEFAFVNRKTGMIITASHLPEHTIDSGYYDSLRNERRIDTDYFDGDVDDNGYPCVAMIKNSNLILNADEEATHNASFEFIGKKGYENYPCLSFSCLANLIKGEVIGDFSSQEVLIDKTNLALVDFTPEETRPASDSLKKDLAAARKGKNFRFAVFAASVKPPSPGFSLIEPVKWHKSATVVIREGKRSFLMGQDEGTYFGCILQDNPKTVEEAYVSLMPKEIRGMRGVIRQGEWFAVPVAAKLVPDKTSNDTLIFGDSDNDNGINMPVEDEDSNIHTVTGDFIVTKKGEFFARNFSMSHTDHEEMHGDTNQWYRFVRNTAVASFSAEKVD